MNSFYILIVRLILGVFFGIIITRIFKPDWNLLYGVGLGLILVAVAYLFQMLRNPNMNK